ncbi:MAG: T9SS type A sorting domain-containing protein [Bacteroidales bacterium]|nr:T9SS type A sorting domain-containing protein [Bacteroidales bacterium]
MRLKLLLVSLLMASGVLYAQDTIRSLVISEAKIGEARFNYVEFTNMGTETLNLVDFEFGAIAPWTDPYLPNDNEYIMIGEYLKQYIPDADTLLGPGETFWISVAYDFNREMAIVKPDDWGPIDRPGQLEADIVMHMYEAPSGPTDSISQNYQVMERWNGRDCWYLRYHFDHTDGTHDSVVIDQVGGVFDNNGRNFDRAYDVAGVTDATAQHDLVRKFTVKKGNTKFAEGRGLDLADSEWMPIQPAKNYSGWLVGDKLRWTAGNHGDYNLDETTLTSSTLDIDWTNQVINVPWGVHNKDSVMMQMDYHPGLSWHYQLSWKPVGADGWADAQVDSSFISARTGDTLIVYACGNDLDEIKFHINLLPPTEDANWVVPKAAFDYENNEYGDWHGPVFEVTAGVPGMDTILEVPFATRTDTIEKYLEKAPDAEWEFVWIDGVERPDVVDGDLLRVTAKNGDVKDYYIQVDDYVPSHNPYLSSIRWPDIPSDYLNVYGYIGDTIPNFQERQYNYRAIVPDEINNIPSLLTKTAALNTRVEVERAVSLAGTVAERTVTFNTFAEDDTTVRVYSVEFYRMPTAETEQPWQAEPFVSEFIWQEQWNNTFLEIANPGTEPIDLSNYMVMFQYTNDPVEMVTWNSGESDWIGRYAKYIPGRRWVDEAQWAITPGVVRPEADVNVNPVVLPGDVFVLGSIRSRGIADDYTDDWWVDNQIDIDFINNPWGESVQDANGDYQSWGTQWINASWFMWKILNDSVRNGTKPANDPADFELLESWASVTNPGTWVVGGRDGNADNQIVSWVRKPQYVLPNPEIEGSWGTQVDNGTKTQDGTSEWLCYDRQYGILQGYGWPYDILYVTEGLGTHYFEPTTVYRSVVVSKYYEVSPGYSMDESILGLKEGITVDQFLSEIDKLDPDEEVTVISGPTGVALANDATITNGDSLVVVSADGSNTSRYFLEVTAEGLSDDALLTSTTYTIDVSGETGTISGFELGTTLRAVINGVTVPDGATYSIIDDAGAYVSLVTIDYDTVEVDVLATEKIYIEVISEDFKNKITYQLTPDVTTSDAIVVSNVYDIDQVDKLIKLVPEGTTVPTFYKNLTPSAGATMQVKNKLGQDRNSGGLYLDDKLNVVAADGETQNTYFLQMLEQEVVYLAYALSNVYIVDQVAQTIVADPQSDINEKTLVSDFLQNLIAAEGATMRVLDLDMVPKDGTDDLDDGDMLEVTAGNGTTVVFYDIVVDPTSARDVVESGLSVYPNPSTGIINVAGLESGNRIRVYNAVGSQVLDHAVVNTTEVISLEDQQQGIYFMTISDKAGIRAQIKLVVE